MADNNLPNPLEGTKFVNKPIYQANPLIEACRGMDLLQGRLYYLALMALNPQLSRDNAEHVKFEPILLETHDIIKLFGGRGGYHENLDEKTNQLKGHVIKIVTGKDDKGDETFRKIGIFDEFEWDPAKGGLRIEFSEKIRPYVFDLVEGSFTKIAGRTMFALQSPYATRLIELLLQYQNIAEFKRTGIIKRNITVKKLRFYLGIADGAIPRMSNFRSYVLDGPIRDINSHTKYKMSYNSVKNGRNIVSFDFFLDVREGNNEQPQGISEVVKIRKDARNQGIDTKATFDNFEADIIVVLRNYGIGKIVARRLAEAYPEEQIRNNISYSLNQNNVKNLPAYIRKAIEEDYFGNTKQAEAAVLLGAQRVAEETKLAREATDRLVEEQIIASAAGNKELTEFHLLQIRELLRRNRPVDRYARILAENDVTLEDIRSFSNAELLERISRRAAGREENGAAAIGKAMQAFSEQELEIAYNLQKLNMTLPPELTDKAALFGLGIEAVIEKYKADKGLS